MLDARERAAKAGVRAASAAHAVQAAQAREAEAHIAAGELEDAMGRHEHATDNAADKRPAPTAGR